jgi:hypothetical protein
VNVYHVDVDTAEREAELGAGGRPNGHAHGPGGGERWHVEAEADAELEVVEVLMSCAARQLRGRTPSTVSPAARRMKAAARSLMNSRFPAGPGRAMRGAAAIRARTGTRPPVAGSHRGCQPSVIVDDHKKRLEQLWSRTGTVSRFGREALRRVLSPPRSARHGSPVLTWTKGAFLDREGGKDAGTG